MTTEALVDLNDYEENVLPDPEEIQADNFFAKQDCFQRLLVDYMEIKFSKYAEILRTGEKGSGGAKTKLLQSGIKKLTEIPVVGDVLAWPVKGVNEMAGQIYAVRYHRRVKRIMREITQNISFQDTDYQVAYLRSVFKELSIELSMIYAPQLSEMTAQGINIFADLCATRAFSKLSGEPYFTVNSLLRRIVILGKNKSEHINDKGIRFKKREIETDKNLNWNKSIFDDVGIKSVRNNDCFEQYDHEKTEKYGYRHPIYFLANPEEGFEDFHAYDPEYIDPNTWSPVLDDFDEAFNVGERAPLYIELTPDLLEKYLKYCKKQVEDEKELISLNNYLSKIKRLHGHPVVSVFRGGSLKNLSFSNGQKCSDLSHCDFTGSVFMHTDFSGITLTKTKFNDAYLQHTIFDGAALNETDFSGANLHFSDFSNVDLKGKVFFSYAHLHFSKLSGLEFLEGTEFISSNMFYINAENTNFSLSNLENAAGCDTIEGGVFDTTREQLNRIEKNVKEIMQNISTKHVSFQNEKEVQGFVLSNLSEEDGKFLMQFLTEEMRKQIIDRAYETSTHSTDTYNQTLENILLSLIETSEKRDANLETGDKGSLSIFKFTGTAGISENEGKELTSSTMTFN